MYGRSVLAANTSPTDQGTRWRVRLAEGWMCAPLSNGIPVKIDG
jgi:hypothetical protein